MSRIPGNHPGSLGSISGVVGYSVLNKIFILNSLRMYKINFVKTESKIFSGVKI